ncbi:MAG: hypothetical protein BA861_00550 [Desulfobacterales bacterium S3730MH5]|nr:MAG: hypothetical protein BA861_00550 [Desulfobacterales bacterium S3730MH5]
MDYTAGNRSPQRARRTQRNIFSPPAALKTQRTRRNDGAGKRLTARAPQLNSLTGLNGAGRERRDDKAFEADA